jgi:hypothetical protein
VEQKFDFHEVISILRASDIVSKIEIRNVDEIKGIGTYRIRCNLIPSRYKLEIRFVHTEKEILYSYQLFTDKPIIRWDNAPHYPKIKTYPHHFHTKDGNVIESDVKGNVIEDLQQQVLSTIKNVLKEHEY